MKAEQKFILSCRQTSEAANRLTDWLDHNAGLLAGGHAAVREDIESLAARLQPLSAAAETVPGIGLLSSTGTRKTDLLFAILAARTPTTVGEFGQRPVDAATIRSLLPFGNDSASCAIFRFSCAEMPPAPRGFPLRIGLLSITDVVAILFGAFATSGNTTDMPTTQDIQVMLGDITDRLSPQALPGLSERDVLDLRDGLTARWPDNPTLAALAATKFWDQFREIAPHLTDKDRRLALTTLWHHDAAYTTLFGKLCGGLDRLGQGADGYCPLEALVGKDKSSGWLTRHPRSIVDEATLLTLDQSTTPSLQMMNRYGQAVEMERSVVAALISELPLHLGMSRLNELAPAELLNFPSAPSIITRRPTTPDLVSGRLSEALTHYARAKAIYLFERSCQRREVTSLIVVVDPAREDDTYTAAISDWVDNAQGSTAHQREQIRRGLYIAAAPALRPPDDDQTSNEARVQFLIKDVIGGDQEWPLAWTPNRPLSEVFWFSGSDAASPPVTSPQTPSHAVTTLAPGLPLAVQRADTSVGQLVRALVLSSEPRIKHLQLNQALQIIRRRLRLSVLRHHTSNDPDALAQWRRGTAIVVQDRLQLIIEHGKLGRLHRLLVPTEDNLFIPLWAAVSASTSKISTDLSVAKWPDAAAGGQRQTDFGAVDRPENLSQLSGSRLAEIAVAHWFQSMRRGARSQRLCRELSIEPSILHHLIDELQIGAVRLALAAEIASIVSQGKTFGSNDATGAGPLSPERDCVRIAAVSSRMIAAYLDVLSVSGGRGPSPPHRQPRSQSHELEVAEAAPAGYVSHTARPWGGARRSTKFVQAQWEVSFVNLVEDNISSSHLLAGRGDKDRELGELIQLFAPGPFEVEP